MLFTAHRIRVFLILFALTLLYFVLRIPTLAQMPIFTDEAIYLRWAQIANNDASWRFISLTDGKQPLYIWFVMAAMRFVTDPLIAGRMVSVGAGFLTMIGLFFLGREVFRNTWIGVIASALYVIYPFSLMYDRMALYDSLVGTFAIWGAYGTVLLARYPRLDIALILGMVAGAGTLNKTSGFFTVYLLPLSGLLFDWNKKGLRRRAFQFVGLLLVVVVATYVYYSLLRLSPYYYIIEQKNATFVYPFSEWIKHPFSFIRDNFRGLSDWLVRYMTFPYVLLALFSFAIKKSYCREKLFLFSWFLIPFVGLMLFGNTLYPRYIFFMTLFLLTLIAYTIYTALTLAKNRSFLLAGTALLICSYLYYDGMILIRPTKSPIPKSDLVQYYRDWPAGVGIKESVAFFSKEAENKKIYIATQGTFGLLPYAYEIYLGNNPNVTIKGYWPTEDHIPDEVAKISKTMPTYFVFYQDCPSCVATGKASPLWPVKPTIEIKKEAPDTYFTVYKVE